MYHVHVCEWDASKFVARNDDAARAPHVAPVFEDRESAQAWCALTNARIVLDVRKNAALEWALAHGVEHEAIDAALKSPDQDGLLEFEKRMKGGA